MWWAGFPAATSVTIELKILPANAAVNGVTCVIWPA
jgi:hypothetical protein